MILLIDNYDSFSYNLYQLIGGILTSARTNAAGASVVRGAGTNAAGGSLENIAGTDGGADGTGGENSANSAPTPKEIRVIRNDTLRPQEIAELSPTHIVISPGPGRPAEAGVCVELIRLLAGQIPIFGVCLGHQAICEAFGARVGYARELMHGKQSSISLDTDSEMFRGLPPVIRAARYHSLAAEKDSIPDALRITARSDDGELMAVQHREFPVYGVQFHPESILTPEGGKILENFLRKD